MVTTAGSINTLIGSLTALSSLRSADRVLQVATKQLQTGYRVADATDDGAIFAVANGVRAQVKAYAAVDSSLAGGQALLAVTLAALTGVTELIGELRGKLAVLSGDLSTEDRATYFAEAQNIFAQITERLESASYNGNNLISLDETIDPNPGNGNGGGNGNGNGGGNGNGNGGGNGNGNPGGGNGPGGSGPPGLGGNLPPGQGGGGAAIVPLSVVLDPNGNTLTLDTVHLGSSYQALFDATADTSASAVQALAALDTFEVDVQTALGEASALDRQLQQQRDFNANQANTLLRSLGVLVDADIGATQAVLLSAQVKHQLATQSLAVANQSGKSVLALVV